MDSGSSTVTVTIDGVPDPVLLRPGTSDADVAYETFMGRYRLPPAEAEPLTVTADL